MAFLLYISGKKKISGSKILRYPDSAMQSAIAAVREGRFKIREASRHFGVPHSTLINKLKGRVPEVRKMGRDTYLTKSEEQLLKNYIIAKAKKGIHIKRTTLLDTVQKILQDDKRVTPFKNHRPGRKWVELFYKRYPELTEKKAEAISTARAKVTAQDLKEWHNSLRQYLEAENSLDILEDPQRIFNADESGFQTCPESGKVLGPVGMKNFYEIKSGKEKEQLTVMVNINAAGQKVPPMIVYPLMRISRDISNNVPAEWAIGKSKSGWMTGPLYFEYIANVFDPWIKENGIKKPVLLLIDGHRSHMTLQVSQYCEQNGIIAYALFPNSTHICQPADVSVFKCLKSGWIKTVHEYKQISGNRQISRAGFAPLLSKVFNEKVTTDIVKNGFEKCGIYPFDISAVDFTKCMDHESRRDAPITQSTLEAEVGVDILLLIESLMRSGRTEQFRQVPSDEPWAGDESAKELFYVWRKLRQRCMINASFDEQNFTPASPSILQKSPELDSQIVDAPLFSSLKQSSDPGTPFSHKTLDHQNIESQMTTGLRSPPVTPTPYGEPNVSEPYSGNAKQKEAHSSEPVTPPLQQDPNSPNIESPTPTRFMNPISIPAMHLESPSSSVVGSLEPASTKLVQLIAEKQKNISPAFGKHIMWPSDSPLKKKKTERLPFATTSKKWQDYWLTKEKEKEEKNKEKENRKRIREENRVKKIKSVQPRKERIKRTVTRESRDSNSAEENERVKIQTENKKKLVMRSIFISDSDSDTTQNNRKTIPKKVPYKRIIIRSDTSDSEKEKQDLCTTTSTYNKGNFVIFSYEGSNYVGRIEDLSSEGVLIKSMQKSLNNWKWPEKEDLNLYRHSDIIEMIEEPRVVNLKRGTFHVEEFKKYSDFI